MSAADAVRLDPTRASAINVDATRRIADWSDRHDRRLVFTSTDLVFDGSRPWNREDDPAEPILAYGRTKRLAESAVLGVSKGIVARLSLLYGPTRCGRPSFFDQAIRAIRSRPAPGVILKTSTGPHSTWQRPPRFSSAWPRANLPDPTMSPDVSE